MFERLGFVADGGNHGDIFRLGGIVALLFVQGFREVFLSFAQLAVAEAMVDKPEDRAPGAYQDKFKMQGKRVVGNHIGGNDTSDKDDQPKDIRKYAHILNLSKLFAFRLGQNEK